MAKPVGKRIRKAYGSVVKECRKAAGYSQDNVPGRGRQHLSSVERGVKEAGLEMLFVLSEALGVSVAEMMERTERAVRSSATLERFEQLSKTKTRIGSDTCPKCGAVFQVFARMLKARKRATHKCLYCGRFMGSWHLPFELEYETERFPPRVK
jgi:transcriptional regulator with XRE-family HTH domain